MYKYILFAIVLVILVFIIYNVFIANSDDARRRRAERYYQASVGNFDENARNALEELTQIEHPEPQDLFRRGALVEYNILEGNIRERFPDRNRRHVAIDAITRDYANAIDLLRGPIIVGYAELNPEFMIYRMENFGERFTDDGDPIVAQMIIDLNDAMGVAAPEVRREIIAERKHTAEINADTKEEAIENYFGDAIKYTSDTQNVHDSKVNNDLRNILAKLKTSSPNADPSLAIDEASEYIRGEYAQDPDNKTKVVNALRVLSTISQGGIYFDL